MKNLKKKTKPQQDGPLSTRRTPALRKEAERILKQEASRKIPTQDGSLSTLRKDAERQGVKDAIAKTRGSLTDAAKALGITRQGVHVLLKRHGLLEFARGLRIKNDDYSDSGIGRRYGT